MSTSVNKYKYTTSLTSISLANRVSARNQSYSCCNNIGSYLNGSMSYGSYGYSGCGSFASMYSNTMLGMAQNATGVQYMYNCDGTFNAGASFAATGLNYFTSGLNTMMSWGMEKFKASETAKAEKQAEQENKIPNLQKLIDEKLKAMGGVAETEVADAKVENSPKYKEQQKIIDENTSTMTTKKSEMDSLMKDGTTVLLDSDGKVLDDIKNAPTTIQGQIDSETNETKKSALQTQLTQAKANLEKANANATKYAAAKTAYDDANKKVETATTERDGKVTTDFNENKEAVIGLIKQKEEAILEQSQNETKATKENKMVKLYDTGNTAIDGKIDINDFKATAADGTDTYNVNNNKNFGKAGKKDIQYVINKFMSAQDENEKRQWASVINSMGSNSDIFNNATDTQKNVIKLAKKYM